MTFALFAALSVAPVQAQIYVDANVSDGAQDGSSWTNAYPDLQSALNVAGPTDEIWIAEGTYYPVVPDDPSNVTPTERQESFRVDGAQDGLTIYGGFQSGDTFADRDPATNVTTLSGDIDQDDDPFAPETDSDDNPSTPSQTDHLRGSNSYHVLFFDGQTGGAITTATALNGVTVTGGNANGSAPDNSGGGLYCDGRNSGSVCSPTLDGVTFAGNAAVAAGGALYSDGRDGGTTSPVITGTTFTGNTASNNGGALYSIASFEGISLHIITNTTFDGNRASRGGALYSRGGRDSEVSPQITGSTFTSNTAFRGGALYSRGDAGGGTSSPVITGTTFTGNTASNNGGALYSSSESGVASPALTNVTFTNNTASGNGGALYNNGSTGTSSPIIEEATFDGNTASRGGAVYSAASGNGGNASPQITDALFTNNTASAFGGAMFSIANFNSAASSVLTNVVFTGNGASIAGGALYVSAASDSEINALVTNGVFADNGTDHVAFDDGQAGASPVFTNCTFTGATSYAFNVDAFDDGQTPMTVENSIVWNNGTDGIAGTSASTSDPDAAVDVAFSIVEEARYAEDSGDPNAGTGNVFTNPFFVDASTLDGPDDTFATADDGLRVLVGSPALDAGDDTLLPADAQDLDDDGDTTEPLPLDVVGATRVQDGTVDLGAYEGGVDLALTFYVDGSGGDDLHDGRTWDTAFATLQQALTIATGNDEIWVAAGTYRPIAVADPNNVTEAERQTSFRLTGAQDGLTIYGGFQSGDAFADRDPTTNTTVLSGDIGQEDDVSDNSYHVLFVDGTVPGSGGVTTATVLDGVTVTGGNADGSPPNNVGGGLYCDGTGSSGVCSPQVTRAVFTDNAAVIAGGFFALANEGGESSPQITNTVFAGNTASLSGGAFFALGDDGAVRAEVTGSVFVDNGTDHVGFNDGGAGASPVFTQCTFTGATDAAFDIRSFDGGQTPIDVTNSILWNNGTDGIVKGSTVGISPDAAVDVAFSIVEEARYAEGSGDANEGEGNINVDPQLIDSSTPAGDDGLFGTFDDGLYVASGSFALDAGDNGLLPLDVADLDGDGDTSESLPLDLAGAARVQDGTVDLGAYEGGVDLALTLYVDGSGGDDLHDGRTWGTAFATLQQALAIATGNDEIWIAAGTYYPDEGAEVMIGDRSASFTLTGIQDGLKIYGGFQSGDTFADRDPATNVTTLSGDIGQEDDVSDNSYHVLFVDGTVPGSGGVTTATVLDGVTVTGGNADGSPPNNVGGGLYCDGQFSECSPALTGIAFTDNTASAGGGAIYLRTNGSGSVSRPVITGATFTNNTAGFRGGALFVAGISGGEARPVILNTVFTQNTVGATGGGSIAFSGNGGVYTALIANTVFAFSGDVHVGFNDGNATGSPRFVGCTFTRATESSFDVSAFGSAQPPIAITNAILWNNGGDITDDDAAVDVTYSIVEEASYASGGANGGTGNINADPQFANPNNLDGLDGVFGTIDDGLYLTNGSLALDAGDNDQLPADVADLDGDGDTAEVIPFDLTGGVRVRENDPGTGPTVDAGAYEALEDTVLPVELAAFTGQMQGSAVLLEWATASEQNNAGFEIQRQSANSAPWTPVGFVEGAGTTGEPQSYRFRDEDVPFGAEQMNYRLRQIDTDGTETFSDAVTIERAAVTALQLRRTFPNPAQGRVTVQFAVPEASPSAGAPVTLRLFDLLGRQVRQVVAKSARGRTEMQVDVSGLTSGVYFLRLTADGQTRTQRLTVVQ